MTPKPLFFVRALILLAVVALPLARAAANKGKAVDDEKKAESVLSNLQPGQIATTANGYSMKAKLNGKEWIASSMISPEAAGRIMGSKGDEYISFPYSKSYLVVGKTLSFGENRQVDLFLNDDVGFWGGRSGELKITKVDADTAEGTFFFTATATGTTKKIEVTDGTFRILLRKK